MVHDNDQPMMPTPDQQGTLAFFLLGLLVLLLLVAIIAIARAS